MIPASASTQRRIDLSSSQIKSLQQSLDMNARGKVVDVPLGTAYDDILETVARVGEEMTKEFTGPSSFKPGGWRVRFLLLESGTSNAYAYWMTSFEAICLTTTLAREIDTLCDVVAKSIVRDSRKGGGFAFLQELDIPPRDKWAMLKGVLMQGAMAVYVGHEAGHLAAGHKPVMTSGASATEAADPQADCLLYVDDFVSASHDEEGAPTTRSLRLNAHEVDADVQGFGLTARYWQRRRDHVLTAKKLPPDATVLRAACAQPERLLLVASTGAAIAIALMGFKTFSHDWNKQRTHPLTAVRCVVGLGALANLLAGDVGPESTLLLRPECMEALSVVHARLGTLLLTVAKYDGKHSDLTRRLEVTRDPNQRLLLMFNATGVAQALTQSNDVVRYIAQLCKEFGACAPMREPAIRAVPNGLVEWSAVVRDDAEAPAAKANTRSPS